MVVPEHEAMIAARPEVDQVKYERWLLRLTTAGRVENLMEALGVNGSELARRIGKSKAWVSKIVSGHQNVRLDTLAEVGHALGVRWSVEPMELPGKERSGDEPPLPDWVHRDQPIAIRQARSAAEVMLLDDVHGGTHFSVGNVVADSTLAHCFHVGRVSGRIKLTGASEGSMLRITSWDTSFWGDETRHEDVASGSDKSPSNPEVRDWKARSA